MVAREGFVAAAPGVRLFYREEGDGVETLVVPNGAWLERTLAPLARGRRVVFYDMRSRGRSDRVDEASRLGFSFDVADLEAVRSHFELESFQLLGHSYPSAVAASYAMDHPKRVSRLVLVGVMTARRPAQILPPLEVLLDPPIPRLREMRRLELDRNDPVSFSEEYIKLFLLPRQLGDPANAGRIVLDACRLPNEFPDHWMRLFFEHVFPSMGEWDYRERLKTLIAPMLVVQGEKEPLRLAGVKEWTDAAPDARYILVPGAGHHPFAERPEIFFPAVETFLSGAWPEGAVPGHASC